VEISDGSSLVLISCFELVLGSGPRGGCCAVFFLEQLCLSLPVFVRFSVGIVFLPR